MCFGPDVEAALQKAKQKSGMVKNTKEMMANERELQARHPCRVATRSAVRKSLFRRCPDGLLEAAPAS